MATRTQVRTQTKTLTNTMIALAVSGLVLSAAAAGLGIIGERREAILDNVARPYQTQGYVPGYVPGYIPGQVPGYGVPGYVPGYGWFRQLTPPQLRAEFNSWINAKLWRF